MQNISYTDFYKPTPYNTDTKNQIWLSQLADSHDNWCNCDFPFAHLLASIFPPGHKDRTRTINQILQRDFRQKCLSGGADAKDSGLAGEDLEKDGQKDGGKYTEEDLPRDEVEELLAAVESAASSPPRNQSRGENMSPNTLRRKYLPRNATGRKPTAAHPPATAAPAGHQVQHPKINITNERTTKHVETTHRTIKLTRFKDGFERETENQLANAFSRPPRMFKEDPPFYPWLPKPEPLVNFHLNFKF
ncbi:hypothetical protein TTmidiV2_gp1 [Torque teno midi virus 2]|uniref:Hepatitis TT virus Orf2/Gyrovirus Vp2 N-terminal domain-containing protein n=1 Tax=Torque teno midi virus 2 TaxID=687380 RepID=A4GZ98_9VIRU|nr:hypothetical protein TTmidiV2_gp1 [Torque teno midi virus 2]BAF49428.1 hypothetical protein [Torque teno midi virus 2]